MVPSILLALTVIVLTIDVLVGIHRGFGFGIIRLGVWLVGTIISMFIARSVTVWILLKISGVPDMKSYVWQNYGNWLGGHTSTIGTHLAGLELSFLVSVVFVGMFLISKFITWIIYLFIKGFIKKAAKKASAHNAAVDAVTAIKASEVSDEAINELEKPYDTDAVLLASAQEEEGFGTFGIYPKNEPETGTELVDSAIPEEEISENVSEELSEELSEDLSEDSREAAPLAEAADEEVQEMDGQADLETDDTENVDESEVDGFESLARAMSDEEEKKEEPEPKKPKKVKEKPVKEKPVKVKVLKKKHSFAVFLQKDSKLSKVLGGVLGLFMGLFACAIIASPFMNLVGEISDEKVAESAVNLVFMLSQPEAKNMPAKLFEKGKGEPVVEVPSYFDIGSEFSLRKIDFVEAITSMDESIVHYVYKYSGADFVASFIHDCLKSIKPEDVGLDNKGVRSYSLPETISCYSELLPDFDGMLSVINERKGVTLELVDKIEDGIDHLFNIKGEGAILTDDDKLRLANGLIERFNERLQINIDLGADLELLPEFTEYGEVKEGLKQTFDMIRVLIAYGYF